jgi:hypothetical protein
MEDQRMAVLETGPDPFAAESHCPALQEASRKSFRKVLEGNVKRNRFTKEGTSAGEKFGVLLRISR